MCTAPLFAELQHVGCCLEYLITTAMYREVVIESTDFEMFCNEDAAVTL